MTVPVPRTPMCTRHHIHMASCIDCCDQRRSEQAAARKRLEAERRRVEAGGRTMRLPHRVTSPQHEQRAWDQSQDDDVDFVPVPDDSLPGW